MGIYEILSIRPEIRQMIRDGIIAEKILDVARKHDFMRMREEGILKALK